MAFIEMTCNCGSSFQADLPDSDNIVLVWAHAFVKQHTECGFMTQMRTDVDDKLTRYDITYTETKEKEL